MQQPGEAELNELLAESVAAAHGRERSAFDEAAGPCRDSIVLMGARKLGLRTLEGLRKSGVEPLAFCDSDPSLWGQTVAGVRVFSPADAALRFGRSAIFVITIWGYGSADPVARREERLRRLGCERVISFGPLYWKYAEALLPRIPATDLPHKVLEQADGVRRCLELWGDEPSRRQYLAQLRWRLHFDFDALPDPVEEPLYFPRSLFAPVPDEVFVDCGAYDGDSIGPFLNFCGRFRRIIAIEPDPLSLARLSRTIRALPPETAARIEVIRAAVSALPGMMPFAGTGTLGSSLGGGDLQVPCITLDAALERESPTFLKMDIEGAELDALRGARETLSRETPVLAICVYHVQDHLWNIPLFIHELNPSYRLFLRQHNQMVEDLVCYAVPPERAR